MAKNEYLHEIIKDLTDVLYEEHGTGVQYRTTLVGVEYFRKKYGDKLKKGTWKETLDAVIGALKEEGIISGAEYEADGNILTIKFASCMHLQMDKELLPVHTKVVNCPCANIAMHFIDNLVGKYSELVKVELNESECTAMIVVMGNTLT